MYFVSQFLEDGLCADIHTCNRIVRFTVIYSVAVHVTALLAMRAPVNDQCTRAQSGQSMVA